MTDQHVPDVARCSAGCGNPAMFPDGPSLCYRCATTGRGLRDRLVRDMGATGAAAPVAGPGE